jgi:hypothetical protein
VSRKEFERLRGEVVTLEAFLANLTEDDVIERVQLEDRLADARAKLERVALAEQTERVTAEVKMIFEQALALPAPLRAALIDALAESIVGDEDDA